MDDDRIQNLKDSLDLCHDWPCVYVFKFIMPTVPDNNERLFALFPTDVEVTSKISKNGKYISFTIKEVILNSDEVLVRYEGASKITGIVAL